MKLFIRYFYPEATACLRLWLLAVFRALVAGSKATKRAEIRPISRRIESRKQLFRCSSLGAVHLSSHVMARARSFDTKLPQVPARRAASSPPKVEKLRSEPLPKLGRAKALPKSTAAGGQLRELVSEELRKVLDEEEVSYHWRRAEPRVEPPRAEPERPPREPRPPRPVPKKAGYAVAVAPKPKTSGAPATTTSAMDLDAAQKAWVSDPLPSVRLVAYDGATGLLRCSALCYASPGCEKTARPPRWLLSWLHGTCSAHLVALALAAEGPLPPTALAAGLASDPRRPVPPWLPRSAGAALSEALQAVGADGNEVLASQVGETCFDAGVRRAFGVEPGLEVKKCDGFKMF